MMAGNVASIPKTMLPCHLPIEGTIHFELAVVLEGFLCFVCEKKKGTATMLLCNQCQRGWHMTCLRLPLTFLPFGQWSRFRCRGFLVLGASTNRTQ